MANIFKLSGGSKNNETKEVNVEKSGEEKVNIFNYEALVGKVIHSKEFCKTGMVLAVKKDAKDRIQYLVSDVDAGLGLISEADLLDKWKIDD